MLSDYWENNYAEMVTFYPTFYRDVYEMDEILKAEGELLDGIDAGRLSVLYNNFVTTMDEDTISLMEEYLGITNSKTRTLEERRRLVLAYLTGFGHVSATSIKKMLSAYTEADIDIVFTTYDPDGTIASSGMYLNGMVDLDGCAELSGEDAVYQGDGYLPGDNVLYITLYRDGTQLCLTSDMIALLSKRLPAHIYYIITDYLNTALDMTETETVDFVHLQMETGIPVYSTDLLDGSAYLDGSKQLNSARYSCVPGIIYAEEIANVIGSYLNGTSYLDGNQELNFAGAISAAIEILAKLYPTKNASMDAAAVVISAAIDTWSGRYLDGSEILDGSAYLDMSRTALGAGLIAATSVTNEWSGIGGTVAYSHDLVFLNGSEKLNGIAIMDAVYEKEEL